MYPYQSPLGSPAAHILEARRAAIWLIALKWDVAQKAKFG
jgi:hypothetical protein